MKNSKSKEINSILVTHTRTIKATPLNFVTNFSILSPFFYMLTSYYSARGSLVLFDNVKNRVTDTNHKRLFPATPARVEYLVSMGTLSPATEVTTINK